MIIGYSSSFTVKHERLSHFEVLFFSMKKHIVNVEMSATS